MTDDDEILRPTVVERLEVRGIGHYLEVDTNSFKTYHDSRGRKRFQFKQDGITIAGPMSAIEREQTLLCVTRGTFKGNRDHKLPERHGFLTPQRHKELFEEFYVETSRQRKANKNRDKES